MKKVSIVLTAVVAFSFLLISWNKAAKIAASVHINDFSCGVLDGNGGFALATGDIVITSSGNGNMKCKATGVGNSTGSAVIWNNANTGLLCGTAAGVTDDWHNVVSASGNVTLQCKVHP